MYKSVILTSLILLGLAGCASMSEKECRGGNWFQAGKVDGASGYTVERLSSHEKACAKYGLNSDRSAYVKGHTEGLRSYCTAESGYEEGIAQRHYRYVCPPELEPEFLREYAKALSERVRELDSRYQEVQRRLERARYIAYRSEDEEKRERAQYRAKQYEQELQGINNQRRELSSRVRAALDGL